MHNIEEKQGYKFTEEFDYIPEDWDVAKIKDKSEVKTGGTPSTSISEYWNGNIKWMSSGELNNKRIYDVVGRITEIGLNNSSANMIPKNSILIGLAGQGKTRGTAAINYVDLSTNQSIAAILPSEYFNSEFLYQCIDKRYEELRELSSGGGGRGGLNKTLIMNLPILLPPLPEQEKIAEVLSDIDELIESTQKLIDKKKDLKTATMQKLLAPKKDWTRTNLGCIANIQRGASPRPIESPVWFDSNSNIGWTRISDIRGKYLKKTEQKLSRLGIANSRFIKENSLIMSICATLGRPTITKVPVCIHDGFVCFFNLTQDIEFVYYFLEFIKGSWLSQGQVGSQSNLNSDLIKNMIICFPRKDKQHQIAQTLSDMDAEIEALEKELNKYKDLKTGMMQELLTGKKRLV